MEKRYQVFVSSTYEDLKDERSSIMQTLLELDCIPSGMELFPAADEDQWSVIKKVIDDCDYYMVIIGGRYGSTNRDGISFTEMEYDYALKTGKPVISLLIRDASKLPAYKTELDFERSQKLILFREKAQKKLCKFWENSSDLSKIVSTSLLRLIKTNPGIGWVKANVLQEQEIIDNKLAQISHFEKNASIGLMRAFERQGDFGNQSSWIDLIRKAEKEVDIQGRTLFGWTKSDVINEIIIEKIINDKIHFRWLIMDTNNQYLNNLTEEDHGIGDMLKEKADLTKKFLIDIKNRIPIKLQNKFEIKYFFNVPLYCSVIRVDHDFYICNYLYSSPSNDSPFMHLNDQSKAWPKLYKREFEALWKAGRN